MSKSACGFTNPHPVTGRERETSILNKQLNEVFPDKKITKEGTPYYGANEYYIRMRENEEFVKWFGDWTTKEGLEKLKKESLGILNEQDEPKLQTDISGNKYILNPKGVKWPIKKLFETISSDEVNDIVNSLTGDYLEYLMDSGARAKKLTRYVDDKIDMLIEDFTDKHREIEEELDEIDDPEELLDAEKLATVIEHQIDKLKAVRDNRETKSLIKKRMMGTLDKYKFNYSEDTDLYSKEDETIDDKEGDAPEYDDVVNFIKDKNESSNRAINDPKVLAFLASIPIFKEYNENAAHQVRVRDEILTTSKYNDQNVIWNLLENVLVDTLPDSITLESGNKNIYDVFVNKIEQVAKLAEHRELNYIAHRLKNIDKIYNPNETEEFKIKFSSAMFLASQNYLITQVGTDPKTDALSFNIIDPSLTNSKEGKLTTEYIETIFNADKLDKSPGRLANIKKGFKDESNNLVPGLIQKFEAIEKSTEPADMQAFLLDMLNDTLGLNISESTVKYLTNSFKGPKENYAPLKSLLHKFLKAQINHEEISKIVTVNPKGEFDLIVEMFRHSNNPVYLDVFRSKLMEEDGFFKQLAKADKMFRKEVSESAVMVGGSQRWNFSSMSGLKMEVLRWAQGNLESVKKLQGRGLRYVNFLLENEKNPIRLSNLKVHINSELKKERDNSPVLHKKITEVDYHMDNMAKLFNSRNKFHREVTSKYQGESAEQKKDAASHSNYVTVNFGADKNSLFSIHGFPDILKGIDPYDYEAKVIKADLKNILNDYVSGELLLAQKASEDIAEYFKQPTEAAKRSYAFKYLIPGYHYSSKKNLEAPGVILETEDFKAGTYDKLGVFSGGLKRYLDAKDTNKNLIYDNKISKYNHINSTFDKSSNYQALMEHVYAEFNDYIKSDFKYLDDIVLISREKEDGTRIEKKMFDVDVDRQIGDNSVQVLTKYIIGSALANYEISNMFNGHVAYYKQTRQDGDLELVDFLKRATAIAADGKYLYHRDRRRKALEGRANGQLTKAEKKEIEKVYYDYDNADPKMKNRKGKVIKDRDDHIVVAVVNNVDIPVSKYAKLIAQATGRDLSLKHEIADAQGYVSNEHFRDLITRLYGWSETDQQMYDELMNPDHKITDDNIRWIKKTSKGNTPLKMMHFEVTNRYHPDEVTNNNIPIYLKYSVAPLFPAIIKGTEMELLHDKMIAQGVDQVVFKSGSKAANLTPTTIHKLDDNGGYAGLDENLKFNPFIIDATKSKLQTELPTKMDKEDKISMQAIKNILTNIDLKSTEKNYTFRGEPMTGEEIYNMVNNAGVALLHKQLQKLLREMGYDKESKKFKIENVKKILIKRADIDTELDLINILESDLPFETVPNFAQRAFPIISAHVRDTAGELQANTQSLVQVANIGYDRLTKEDAEDTLFFDKDNSKLTPPLPEVDENGNIKYYDPLTGEETTKAKGGKMRIQKAKILIPFSSIFAKSGMSYNEFKRLYQAGKIDEKIFKNALGYRIPNQAISSNDSFEIVGVLPPLAGDQAVVYHEITAKTGSDFDIDKMYMAIPNFKVKHAKSTYKKASKWALNNLGFEYMKQTLIEIGYDEKTLDINDKDVVIYFVEDVLFGLYQTEDSLPQGKSEEAKEYIAELRKETPQGIVYERADHNTPYGEMKKPALQNEFIELLTSILESPATYGDLMAPLDNDMIKNAINEIMYLKTISQKERDEFNKLPADKRAAKVDEFIDATKPNALQNLFPVKLNKSRTDMLEAKTLVAIMANNMTDLGESQKVGFALNYSLGIKHNDSVINTLDRIYQVGKEGQEEFKLSKVVSYLMNASVDAAKDSYIISGNFTSYSANGAMMLTRLGMDMKSVFAVLMNDEIAKFSRYKTFQRAKVSDYSFAYSQKELDQWSKELIADIAANNGDLSKVISEQDFLDNTPEKKEQILGFWNLVQTMGKEFNDAVVAMKSDANGAGRNIAEFISIKNRIERVKQGATTGSFKKWFDGEYDEENMKFNPDIINNGKAKIMGAMANNTLFLMDELTQDMFLETTVDVKNAINDMLSSLGRPLETDASTIQLLYDYLYPYLLTQTGHWLYNIDAAREEYLLKEFPAKLVKYRAKYGNDFLKELIITTNKKRNLIIFPNFKNFATKDKQRFKEIFTEMMVHTSAREGMDKADKQFIGLANDLVQYSFLTTGFKSKYYSFNDVIPAGFFLDSMHGKHVQALIDKMNNPMRQGINYKEAMILMAMDHPKNFKIVKKLGNKQTIKNLGDGIAEIENEKSIDRLLIGENAYAPFFLKHTQSGDRLYMYRGRHKVNKTAIYEKIKARNVKDFSTYSYHEIINELNSLRTDNISYESEVRKLYENLPPLVDLDAYNQEDACE